MNGVGPLPFPDMAHPSTRSRRADDVEAVSALLLDWHTLAQGADAGPGFRRAALDALARVLPFDSAWWGTSSFRPGRMGVLQADLWRLPARFIADWWSLADVDGLAQAVRQAPGRTVLDAGDRDTSAAERAFDERHDLRSALSTGVWNEEAGLVDFLSVFRGTGSPRFDEADRAAMERLMPHLLLADRVQGRAAAWRQLQGAPVFVARLDDALWLQSASSECCAALVAEFPTWSGGDLPAPLARIARAGAGRWSGRGIEVTAFRADDGGVGLSLRPRIGRGLTPREESVARAYAGGASYKQIAQDQALSPATVRGYLRSAYDKLGVGNKAALARVIDQPGG